MVGRGSVASLRLIRHGESLGNLARLQALEQHADFIEIAPRDMDVDLSPRGHEQARAVGQWLAGEASVAEAVVVTSPYRRALQTAEAICVEASLGNLRRDERLREREFGALDRLTSSGIQQRFPAEAEARARIGKFYYRPPGGESWCDVALRVRSMLGTLAEDFVDRDVIVVAHEVVILLFRYVIEDLTEHDVLEISRRAPMANCAVTTFVRNAAESRLVLQTYGETLPVEESDATVTAESDAPVAPR